MSELILEIYERFGEAHMAEFDWALTPESRERIEQQIMIRRELPSLPLEVEKVSFLDGCKIYLKDGWVIIRFSGTEPRVRIFAEAETAAQAEDLVRTAAEHTGLPFPPVS
jgi:phosphomannomutase